jgi:hypothetical protein
MQKKVGFMKKILLVICLIALPFATAGLFDLLPGKDLFGLATYSVCPAPYHIWNPQTRTCTWSCGYGTEPDIYSLNCVCLDGWALSGFDQFNRIVCRPQCLDSDFGLDFYTWGVVNHRDNLRFNDSCDGDMVVEWYCYGNNFTTQVYSCPHGCSDGACRFNTTSCTDSDYGLDFYNRGFATFGDYPPEFDYCDGNVLVEQYCYQNNRTAQIYRCQNGCSDGACQISQTTCLSRDTNCNGRISDEELLSAAQLWLINQITDNELLEVASIWLG